MRALFGCIQVRVRIRGADAGVILDAAGRAGVAMRGIALERDGLSAWVAAADLFQLRPALRAIAARARFTGRRGPGVWLALALSRPGFLAGSLVLVAAYAALASRVWWVSVAEGPRVPAAGVLGVVRALGLRPGEPVAAIRPHVIERAVLARFPDLGWVGMAVDGVRVRLIVMVRPAEPLPPPRGAEPLRAMASGIVTHIEVHEGSAAVAVGETVVKGQVLIRPEEAGEPVPPAGVVLGRTFHQVRVFEPFVVAKRRWRPPVTRLTVVRVDGEPLRLGQPPPGSVRQSGRLLWRNPLLPVEVEQDTYARLSQVNVRRSPAATRRAALKVGRALLRSELPRSYRLVEEHVRFVTTRTGVELTVTTDTEQDLALGAASTPKGGRGAR